MEVGERRERKEGEGREGGKMNEVVGDEGKEEEGTEREENESEGGRGKIGRRSE